MKSRFLKLSLANFGYKYSKKGSKSFGSALIYVGASFLLLAIILTVLNFARPARTSDLESADLVNKTKIDTASIYLNQG
jgi:hypothetical protein